MRPVRAGRIEQGTIRPGAMLASPVFVGSVALLLLNDHVLKAAWPGLVTGKLSDVAGVVMVAIGLTALLRRPGFAFGLTAVAFRLLKTVPVVAVWAEPVLGGVTLTDPTDVVALLALVPLWRWMSRPTSSAPRAVWLLPVQIVAVGCAVFATTATSCGEAGISSMAATEGVVHAFGEEGDRYISEDAGLTWAMTSEPPPVGLERWSSEDCDAGTCVLVRSVPGPSGDREIVVRDGEPTERVVFRMTDDDVERLDRAIRPACGTGSYLGSVTAVATDDGVALLLPLGEGGALRRDPVGGWQLVQIGEFRLDAEFATADDGVTVFADSLDTPIRWGRGIAQAVPLALIGILWATSVPIVSAGRRRGRPASTVRITCGVLSVVFGLPALVLAVLTDDPFGAFLYAGWIVLMAVAFAISLVVLALTVGGTRRPLPPPDPGRRVG